MKAVIMAGGEGTRLRPLTSNQPKPMMPLVNRPMLEHIVALLAKHGFDDIVVTVAYLGNQIRDYFGDGSDFGVRMRYATEEQPLGTAGSVRNAADELDETFLVISGDVLTDIDLGAFVDAHREKQAVASIALKRVENPLEFGIVITRPDGSIERFLEKPTWGEVFSDTINTGIYVLEPSIFEHIPLGEVVDFSGDVFPKVLDDGGMIHGHVADGYWEDVGTTEAYLRAHADVLDGRVEVDIAGFVARRRHLARGGCRGRPRCPARGAPGDRRRTAASRPARRCGATPCSAPTSSCAATRSSSARCATTTCSSATTCRLAGQRDRPLHRPPRRTRGSKRAW